MDKTTRDPVQRRNFRLSIINGGMMIGTSNSVASPDLVLTAFAANLTDNPLILGLVAPLQGATWSLPQIWSVEQLQRRKHALPIYNQAAFLRLICWVVLCAAALLSHNTNVLLLALMIFVLIGGTAAGVAGLPFIEVVGKIIPPRQRGLVFGWRGALGGFLSIIGAQVVIFFTGPKSTFDFPTNFALLFVFGMITQMIGFFSFSLVIEPPTEHKTQHLKPTFNVLRTIWRSDDNYRHYVRGRTFFELSSVANGLIIVYANQMLGVRLELIGVYLLISSVLRPLFSIYAGRVSLRIGNRIPVAVGVLAQAAGWGLLLLAPVIGVKGSAAEYYLVPIYTLTAIQKGLVFSNLMALGLNVTPEDERPLYMGALNTWIGFVTLAGALSGVIVKSIGFESLFFLMAILSLLSVWQFFTLNERMDDGIAA
ncbi:MAG: MFS transporter [Chloroflexi bacterium]|nr:MFS transporter [Chloroflexota bacterium]